MDESSLLITVTRTGGFAGLRREWSVTATEPDDAEALQNLIDACPWDDRYDDGHADGYLYDFRAADPKAVEHRAVVPENQLCDPWRQLRDEVQRRAEAQ